MHVALIAFDDFTDLDLFLPWDLLHRVEGSVGLRVRILGDAAHHTSVTGLPVPVHGPLSEANDADAVLFTSGKGARRKVDDAQWLSSFALDPKRQLIGSMCSGALLLAALGLLEGKRATTYPTSRAALSARGVEVVEASFVEEGNLATAAGCLAAQELCGWVIERLCGRAQRETVLRSIQPVGRGLAFADADPARGRLPASYYGRPG